MTEKKKVTFEKIVMWVLIIGGAIGLTAASILMIDKIQILKDPLASLGCDINPVVACGSVINTSQASAFGFPNPFIGIASFAVVATVGVAVLAEAKFKRWFWLGLQFGTIFGILFIHWLAFQSLYRIGALCPYCMVIWSVTIPIFWYTTLYNLETGVIPVKKKYEKLVNFLKKHHAEILVTWYLLFIVLILERFWYYWSTLI